MIFLYVMEIRSNVDEFINRSVKYKTKLLTKLDVYLLVEIKKKKKKRFCITVFKCFVNIV